MKVLITGAQGQLGFDCLRQFRKNPKIDPVGIDVADLDLTDFSLTEKYLRKCQPDVVVHCAAWTQVDLAEKNPEKVFLINAEATGNLARICQQIQAKLVYISTDYVFSGTGTSAREVDEPKEALSVYGKSKALGEEYVQRNSNRYFILRISGAFGIHGNNFVKTMLKLSQTKKEIYVVCDQIGSVTYTVDLARQIEQMIFTDRYGIYHVTNEGFLSWYDFAEEIFKQAHQKMVVHPISTEEYRKMVDNQAYRPLNSRLSKTSLVQAGFPLLPRWEDALSRFLKELKENE